MSLAQIRDEFRVPARPGAHVTHHDGTHGTITGATGNLIRVTTPNGDFLAHPTHLTYH